MLVAFILVSIVILIPLAIHDQKTEHNYRVKLSPNGFPLSEFLVRKEALNILGYGTDGVYVITNKTKGDYVYVGQSIDAVNRVSTHISGRGNIDVHVDFSKGDEMTVAFIRLKDTNFVTLDKLEKHLITKHNAYYKGYNKTRGNG